MNFIVAKLIAFCVFQHFSAQAALNAVTSNIEVPVADSDYFKDTEVHVEDEGKDNEFFMNFTLIKTLPKNAMVDFKLMGASMGEYVVETGFNYTEKMCDAIKDPTFGAQMFEAIGFNKDVCPTPPGVYGGSHINMINQNTLPDTLPPNDYMAVFTTTDGQKVLHQLKVYGRVQ